MVTTGGRRYLNTRQVGMSIGNINKCQLIKRRIKKYQLITRHINEIMLLQIA